MRTGVAVRTLRSRKEFPGGARLFLLFPLDVTSEEVEGIDLLRVSLRIGLRIRAEQGLLDQLRAPAFGV
jgi:hypothetical protein